MSERLIVCPDCRRHLRAAERACPFCRAALDPSQPLPPPRRGVVVAAAIVALASAAACEDATQPPARSPATPPTAAPADMPATLPAAAPATPSVAVVPDAGKRGGDEPAAVYGGPPPR